MRKTDRAFTLFEVLAAVALLGILYTTLAGITVRWLGAEGESRRRLEASLVADRVLGEMETEMAVGLVPPLGPVERDEDWYHLKVLVTALPWKGSGGKQQDAEPAPAGSAEDEKAKSPVRRIEVTVTWTETFREAQVIRTTYAYDLVALLTASGVGGEPEGEQ